MDQRPPIPVVWLRYACALTALANVGGNAILVVFYRDAFRLLGVPLPADLHLFTLGCAYSFTMGVVAWLAFRERERPAGLLAVGIVGKGLYAAITYYFWAVSDLHWFFMIFVIWDVIFVVLFFLYWIATSNLDLVRLQHTVLDGTRPAQGHGRRALLLTYSLTGTGAAAMRRLEKGLRAKGYACDVVEVAPTEAMYRWPISLIAFVKIIARAFVRGLAPIAPLALPTTGADWDLVAVVSPTWLLGMAAPVESALVDRRYADLFRGRDAAVVVVARGAYQRTLGMMVRRLEAAGANVVAARGLVHPGSEPRRLMSLWFYLIFRRPGVPPVLAAPTYGLSEEALASVERLGEELAERPRTRPAPSAEPALDAVARVALVAGQEAHR